MFFKHETGPIPEGQTRAKKEIELNINGEPKYLMTPDGSLIINDPTLLIERIPEEAARGTSEEVAEPSQ